MPHKKNLLEDTKKQSSTKGFSVVVCFGTYGGFYFVLNTRCFRICAGWVSLTFYFSDFENLVNNYINDHS